MSIPTYSDLIDGWESLLKSLGLRFYRRPPGDPEPPAAIAIPPEIDYRQAMGAGVIRLEQEIVLLVPAVVDRQMDDLNQWLDWSGAKSIRAAVDADKTLGVPNLDVTVMGARPLGLEEVAAYNAYGAALTNLIVVTNRESP